LLRVEVERLRQVDYKCRLNIETECLVQIGTLLEELGRPLEKLSPPLPVDYQVSNEDTTRANAASGRLRSAGKAMQQAESIEGHTLLPGNGKSFCLL
jgi:hypothetical protein